MDSSMSEAGIPVRRRRLHILVVDDEPDALEMMERMLAPEFDVLTAENGAKALELLRAHPDVAVIITDQRMPGMSGVRLLEQSIQVAPNAVRIMVSAYTETDDLLDAINQGQARGYVVKPVSKERLLGAVRKALETYYIIMELQERAQKKAPPL